MNDPYFFLRNIYSQSSRGDKQSVQSAFSISDSQLLSEIQRLDPSFSLHEMYERALAKYNLRNTLAQRIYSLPFFTDIEFEYEGGSLLINYVVEDRPTKNDDINTLINLLRGMNGVTINYPNRYGQIDVIDPNGQGKELIRQLNVLQNYKPDIYDVSDTKTNYFFTQ